MKIPKDTRKVTWRQLEKRIQLNTGKKDKSFVLKGKWKKFVRRQKGFKIFSVDGAWIRNNLCVYFDHGGHTFVYEFIPADEIWVTSHHYNKGNDSLFNCCCKTRKKGQKISKKFFESTFIHEIKEYEEMKKGKSYWKSHNLALEKERQIGLLVDPFCDL